MVNRPKRRRRRTPPATEAPQVQEMKQAAPQEALPQPPNAVAPATMDIPLGTVVDAAGNAVSNEELAKIPLTQEEKDRLSLQAALSRAAEIEENDDRGVNGGDKFAYDRRIIPAGWEYQWRTDTVLNQRDPSYQVELQKMGWKPVPASRHPEMMPIGWTSDYIIRGGQILMEMPKAIVDRARIMEHRRALDAVRVKEDQLNSTPAGGFSRRGQASKSFGPMEIPAKAS